MIIDKLPESMLFRKNEQWSWKIKTFRVKDSCNNIKTNSQVFRIPAWALGEGYTETMNMKKGNTMKKGSSLKYGGDRK